MILSFRLNVKRTHYIDMHFNTRLETLPDIRSIHSSCNALSSELSCGTDTRQHEDYRRVD